jgi:hypothetical protein
MTQIIITIDLSMPELKEKFRNHFNAHIAARKRRKIKVTKQEVAGWIASRVTSELLTKPSQP